MSDKVLHITDGDFSSQTQSGVVLVDFWAPWCGPCLQQAPILDQVAEKIGDKATIGKVDVDTNMESAGKFGVQSIPTLVLLKDGAEVTRFVGVQSEDDLIAAIEKAL